MSVTSVLLIILLAVIVVWLIARSRTDKIPVEWHVSTVNPDYMQDYDGKLVLMKYLGTFPSNLLFH